MPVPGVSSDQMDDDSLVKEVLGYPTIAVVGCSPKEHRPSHWVARYLQTAGYKIIPVNPAHAEILGEKCYPNLLQIPVPVDVVNIFRKSEEVFPIVKDAIQMKAKAIWMQDGVEHLAGKELAEKAGLKVIMNDCMMRQHTRLGGPFHKTITTC